MLHRDLGLVVFLLLTGCQRPPLAPAATGAQLRPPGRTAPTSVVALLPLTHAPPAKEQFADLDVAHTLTTLFNRMYVIGETSGSLAAWDAAIGGAAAHISERMADPAHHGELLASFGADQTPLSFASANGYPQVVDVLLSFESVRANLEDPGRHGLTAWQLSNLAPHLSLLALNPAVRGSEWTLIPYVVKTPYYTDRVYAPYHRVRESLARAGANQDLAPVKAFIANSQVCPDEVKARVEASSDVLGVLLHLIVHDRTYGLPSLTRR